MLTSSVATALAFNLPRRSSRSSTTAACAWQTSWILGAMGGDVAVSTVVMPSGVAVGRGRPRQHSAGPGRSRSSIPQTPTRSWIHGLHQDRSVSCPFSERWLASFFYIMYIFINLSPRNGKSQGPDDQIEHELREVFACLTGSRSARTSHPRQRQEDKEEQ